MKNSKNALHIELELPQIRELAERFGETLKDTDTEFIIYSKDWQKVEDYLFEDEISIAKMGKVDYIRFHTVEGDDEDI